MKFFFTIVCVLLACSSLGQAEAKISQSFRRNDSLHRFLVPVFIYEGAALTFRGCGALCKGLKGETVLLTAKHLLYKDSVRYTVAPMQDVRAKRPVGQILKLSDSKEDWVVLRLDSSSPLHKYADIDSLNKEGIGEYTYWPDSQQVTIVSSISGKKLRVFGGVECWPNLQVAVVEDDSEDAFFQGTSGTVYASWQNGQVQDLYVISRVAKNVTLKTEKLKDKTTVIVLSKVE